MIVFWSCRTPVLRALAKRVVNGQDITKAVFDPMDLLRATPDSICLRGRPPRADEVSIKGEQLDPDRNPFARSMSPDQTTHANQRSLILSMSRVSEPDRIYDTLRNSVSQLDHY